MRGGHLMTQLFYALENMRMLLEATGSGLHEVARATLYMNPADLRVMNAVWSALYPDEADRPPHKWVPAVLPPGHAAMVEFLAVRGARERRCLEVEDMRHGDPMTMAAVTDGLVTSSRVIASRRDTPREYAAAVFDNIEEIMASAGGSIADLTQATAFIGEPEYAALVEEQLTARLPAGTKRPVVHYVEAGLGGQAAPRVEILGVIPPAR